MNNKTHLIVKSLTPKEHRRIVGRISVDINTGCWNWTGCTDTMGYGLVWFRNRREKVHRIMFAWKVKSIPRGKPTHTPLMLDHKTCQNKRCCNPDHLELVTHRENVLRGTGPSAINHRKTHCIYGHLLTMSKNGSRRDCRTCDSIRKKERMDGPNREYWLEKARQNTKRYYDKKRKK